MKKFSLFILLMIFVFIEVRADLRLKIPPYRQWGRNTCWAAVCVQIFNAYGEPQNDEKLIRCWATEDAVNCNTSIDGPTDVTKLIVGCWRGVEEILFDFRPNTRIYGYHIPHIVQSGHGAPSPEELITQIHDGRPFVVGIQIDGGASGHMVLGVGYTGDGDNGDVQDLIYNQSTNGTRSQISYNNLITNPDQIWYETYMLESNPREPIPTPVDPDPSAWVMLADTGSYEIDPDQNELSFFAERNNSDPVNWTFVIYILHRDGKYTCTYETFANTTQQQMTWSIDNFSFAPNEKWIYDCDGKIIAEVETIIVSDYVNVRHNHIIRITPDGALYPGISASYYQYVDETLSDQEAHQYMHISNSEYQSNAYVNFFSGGMIEIGPNVYIDQGAYVNFEVIPDMW